MAEPGGGVPEALRLYLVGLFGLNHHNRVLYLLQSRFNRHRAGDVFHCPDNRGQPHPFFGGVVKVGEGDRGQGPGQGLDVSGNLGSPGGGGALPALVKPKK